MSVLSRMYSSCETMVIPIGVIIRRHKLKNDVQFSLFVSHIIQQTSLTPGHWISTNSQFMCAVCCSTVHLLCCPWSYQTHYALCLFPLYVLFTFSFASNVSRSNLLWEFNGNIDGYIGSILSCIYFSSKDFRNIYFT